MLQGMAINTDGKHSISILGENQQAQVYLQNVVMYSKTTSMTVYI